MVVENPSDGRPNREPTWWRVIGLVLMLPIGIMFVLLLYLLFGVNRAHNPGEMLTILLLIFLLLFVARVMFRRSRRRYWVQQRAQKSPRQILRERYARGEITREQFEEMSSELRDHR